MLRTLGALLAGATMRGAEGAGDGWAKPGPLRHTPILFGSEAMPANAHRLLAQADYPLRPDAREHKSRLSE
jgi:hypothetical protein